MHTTLAFIIENLLITILKTFFFSRLKIIKQESLMFKMSYTAPIESHFLQTDRDFFGLLVQNIEMDSF